jgi:hypothetical protein
MIEREERIKFANGKYLTVAGCDKKRKRRWIHTGDLPEAALVSA